MGPERKTKEEPPPGDDRRPPDDDRRPPDDDRRPPDDDARRPDEDGGPEETSPPPPGPKVYPSLHHLLEGDDPFANEPFWPPILLGLGLMIVILIAILIKHGVISR